MIFIQVYLRIYERLFGFFATSLLISKISNPVGYKIRYSYYSRTLNSVGTGTTFPYGIIFSTKDISIGSNVRFGPFNNIGLVDFKDNILIAQNVSFLSGSSQHGYARKDIPMIDQPGEVKRITIGEDVWIGANCVITETVAKGSILGSLCLYNKQHPPYAIVGGVPAKIIGER